MLATTMLMNASESILRAMISALMNIAGSVGKQSYRYFAQNRFQDIVSQIPEEST